MKQAIFTMGTPGAGKSYITQKRYSDWKILDCDDIKKLHPDYNPTKPQDVHMWSKIKLEKEFQKALRQEESFVLDGTGGNTDRLSRRIHEAKDAGFNTKIVYVTCSLSTALRRNKERDRNVSEDIVKQKYKDVIYGFHLVASLPDDLEVVRNDN